MEQARKWWEKSFPDSVITGAGLPKIDTMKLFWESIFPPLALLSDYITNTDQYWKKMQRIMTQMSDNQDIPCPFQKLKLFILAFYEFVQKIDLSLNSKSKKLDYLQLIKFLECMPKSYEPHSLIWNIPAAVGHPESLLVLLDLLHTSKHWIWNALMNCDGVDDLLFDRLSPYISPLSKYSNSELKYYKLLAIDIVTITFMHNPRFPDPFDSLFSRYLNVMKNGSVEESIHCFRSLTLIFEKLRSQIGTGHLCNYMKDFAGTAISIHFLRRMFVTFLLSLKLPNLSVSFISRLLLQNNPDHNDIDFITTHLIPNNNHEKHTSIVLKMLSLAVTDMIISRSIIKSLNSLRKLFDSHIPIICTFIQNAVGFVIIAQANETCARHVSMIFDLLKALLNLNQDWLKNEVMKGAAILLASQKVPLAFANSLKPSMHCDKAELVKWEKMANNISFNDMMLLIENIKDDKGQKPAPPTIGVRSAPPRNFPKPIPGPSMSSHVPKAKPKGREVMKPFVRNSQSKYLRSTYRSNQS
ncbi:hypothetical protein TRFO_06627 [Tritrichomonas foetus]|uniref:Uncharacterized protein n=1 Tax=Tritrichomonas foetus TaxID=1144522 RepID=A0A1J4K0Z2_9EUKA|nr:hypothetical protein TRFO_06627 [Tritrichomonas foetus]|eukprot:OHT03412.1 hypothetical protein TRFO_06627 [Tritrichomonas foetus]